MRYKLIDRDGNLELTKLLIWFIASAEKSLSNVASSSFPPSGDFKGLSAQYVMDTGTNSSSFCRAISDPHRCYSSGHMSFIVVKYLRSCAISDAGMHCCVLPHTNIHLSPGFPPHVCNLCDECLHSLLDVLSMYIPHTRLIVTVCLSSLYSRRGRPDFV